MILHVLVRFGLVIVIGASREPGVPLVVVPDEKQALLVWAELRLEIADTGQGINEEAMKNIFEPFYTTKEQGLGLGMPYAKKIIEQHGGAISCNSRPAEGTTIRVELPVSEREVDNGWQQNPCGSKLQTTRQTPGPPDSSS